MVSSNSEISSKVGTYTLEDASFKSRFNLRMSKSVFLTAHRCGETVTSANAREIPETNNTNALVISIDQA